MGREINDSIFVEAARLDAGHRRRVAKPNVAVARADCTRDRAQFVGRLGKRRQAAAQRIHVDAAAAIIILQRLQSDALRRARLALPRQFQARIAEADERLRRLRGLGEDPQGAQTADGRQNRNCLVAHEPGCLAIALVGRNPRVRRAGDKHVKRQAGQSSIRHDEQFRFAREHSFDWSEQHAIKIVGGFEVELLRLHAGRCQRIVVETFAQESDPFRNGLPPGIDFLPGALFLGDHEDIGLIACNTNGDERLVRPQQGLDLSERGRPGAGQLGRALLFLGDSAGTREIRRDPWISRTICSRRGLERALRHCLRFVEAPQGEITARQIFLRPQQ
jgi:hypothetical protein